MCPAGGGRSRDHGLYSAAVAAASTEFFSLFRLFSPQKSLIVPFSPVHVRTFPDEPAHEAAGRHSCDGRPARGQR